MINKIYAAINKIVFQELVENPDLLNSIENEEILSHHVREQEDKLHILSNSINNLTLEELAMIIHDDDKLV